MLKDNEEVVERWMPGDRVDACVAQLAGRGHMCQFIKIEFLKVADTKRIEQQRATEKNQAETRERRNVFEPAKSRIKPNPEIEIRQNG